MIRGTYVSVGLMLIGLISWGLMISLRGKTAEGSLDLSTPEMAFQSLQEALEEMDASAIERILGDIPEFEKIRRRIAENYIEAIQKIKSGEKIGRGEPWFLLLWKGNLVRVEQLDVKNFEEEAREGICRVWLSWPEGRKMGYACFVKQNGQWKWLPVFEFPPVYDAYDFSTPTKSLLSVRRAQNIFCDEAVAGESDVLSMYKAIASDLKSAISFEEYDKLVKARKRQGGWTPLYISSSADHLEEEIVEIETGEFRCKVWKLDKEGKRVGFELFVKEGSEWKWLPDQKYIWFPAKVGKKENEQLP